MKFIFAVVGIALLCLSVFLTFTAAYLAWSEILPAIRQGSLSVGGNSIILNTLWEGNEIYGLLFAYLVLAAGFAYGAYRVLRAITASK
jgi:hypothetical protein